MDGEEDVADVVKFSVDCISLVTICINGVGGVLFIHYEHWKGVAVTGCYTVQT